MNQIKVWIVWGPEMRVGPLIIKDRGFAFAGFEGQVVFCDCFNGFAIEFGDLALDRQVDGLVSEIGNRDMANDVAIFDRRVDEEIVPDKYLGECFDRCILPKPASVGCIVVKEIAFSFTDMNLQRIDTCAKRVC